MSDTTGQNVYVIEHEHGYVKIGVSNNPAERMAALETACPYELTLLGEIQTDSPFEVETRLHDKFEHQHKRGEWYALDTRDRAHLLALCDLDAMAVNRRYAVSQAKRRELTLKTQALR